MKCNLDDNMDNKDSNIFEITKKILNEKNNITHHHFH